MSDSKFDVEDRWPELFDRLDAEQRRAVVSSLAAGWHEGWEPNREDVADLIDYTRGLLAFDEYRARSEDKTARIARAAAARPAAGDVRPR